MRRLFFNGMRSSRNEAHAFMTEAGMAGRFKILGNVDVNAGQGFVIQPGDYLLVLDDGTFAVESHPESYKGMQELLRFVPDNERT